MAIYLPSWPFTDFQSLVLGQIGFLGAKSEKQNAPHQPIHGREEAVKLKKKNPIRKKKKVAFPRFSPSFGFFFKKFFFFPISTPFLGVKKKKDFLGFSFF